MTKRRAMTTERARFVRQRGHDDALQFALAIGLSSDYANNKQAKKDVIDPSGDAHSVKSGEKRWQIFLYGLEHFWADDTFNSMGGMGGLFVDCINAFPPAFSAYCRNKKPAKERLQVPMRRLADTLQDKQILRAFLDRSLFNTGEVDYLTVKHEGLFHVFSSQDVVRLLGDCLSICNSKARLGNQMSDLKVLFRYADRTLGEIEMRTDSEVHYREVKFCMMKPRVVSVLLGKIPLTRTYSNIVQVYGVAGRRFGRWKVNA